MSEPEPAPSPGTAPLLIPIIGTAVTLGIVGWLLATFVPEGRLVLSFFIPALYGVSAFAGLSIGFLAIARFRVLFDSPSYWISVGFFSFAILAFFVVLTFPGSGLEGAGLIAALPNTAAWFGQTQMMILAIALVLAALAPWPGSKAEATCTWLVALVATCLLLLGGGVLLVRLEARLPLLVLEGGIYSRLQTLWVIGILIVLAGGALLSTRRYLLTRDNLVGYVAMTQVAFAFGIITASDAMRFSTLWYMSRLLGLVGLAATLFGLLSEYVALFKREREARSETLERAQQLRATLESMADAVFVSDAEGHVTMTNRAARRLLGVGELSETDTRVIELTGLLEIRRVDGTPIPSEELPFSRALAGELIRDEDLIARSTKTGKDIYFRTSAAPVVIEEKIVGAVALGQDITENIQIERMKEDFIRVAAHELKTPVTIMKGYAQALPEALRQKPEQRDKMLAAINRGADRITELVQDLMDISQLQLGDLRLRVESVDLRKVASGVVERLAPLSPGHVLRLAAGDSVGVQGDHDRLEQVIGHLIENAIKFSPEGGPVDVSVESRGEDGFVAVKDLGAGIPRDRQGHIFERFFRAHAGTPLDFGGMGVGLYISKQIIDAHGGRAWFESREGEGSTFFFTVPKRGRG